MNSKMRKQRSKFREVERIYFCKYPNCSKGYGRLNHLNDHIKIQNHGELRKPSEFALERKKLKRRKLQEEILQETNQIIANSPPDIKEKDIRLPPISTHTVATQLPLSPSQYSSFPSHTQHIPSPIPIPLQGNRLPPPPLHPQPHHYQYQLQNPIMINQNKLAAAAAMPSPPTILPPLANFQVGSHSHFSYDQYAASHHSVPQSHAYNSQPQPQ